VLAGVGYELQKDTNVANDNTPGFQLSQDPTNTAYSASNGVRYVFGQYLQQIGVFGIAAGVRYDSSTTSGDLFGNAVAPRLGVTYSDNGLSAKLLYGRAFHIPTVWQVYSRILGFPGKLGPETADNYQAEVGYKFTSHVSAKVNLFFVDIRNPIVFNGATVSYQNAGRIQTMGAEGELAARWSNYGGFVNVGYDRPGPATTKTILNQEADQFLGLPPVKANVGAYLRYGKFQFSPSFTFLSQRYAQTAASSLDTTGTNLTTETHPVVALLNANASVTDVVPGLDLNLSGHNLLGADYVLLQPYYGGHAPMATNDRQVTLGGSYKF
jgi:outer membrane cobalamin receptor